MRAQALMPRFPVPALNLPLTNGERFVLGANPGEKFDLIVFYRSALPAVRQVPAGAGAAGARVRQPRRAGGGGQQRRR
jgi:hypothetical protein